jgi:DNA-binding transcriptional MerR regulator
MQTKTFEIQELVDLSGVPRRNVYFYVQQGLLPPPSGAGLGARYAEEHLLRLRLIPLLRQQGLRLDQIREKLAGLQVTELQALADGLVQPPAPPKAHPPLTPPLFPERPGLGGQACVRYDLPGGIVVLVPAGLHPEYRPLLERILASVSGDTRQI